MESIQKHRTGALTVVAESGAQVNVEQIRHAFEFGTAINHRPFLPENQEDSSWARYRRVLEKHFNAAVHENALKWYHTQRQAGEPDYSDAERMVEWCRQRGISVRGHCIFWEVEKMVQSWIGELSDEALLAAVEKRAKEVTTRFKGRIGEYDLNNEMLHGDFFTRRLGQGIVDKMFAWAKEGDGDARLYLNDYSILQGGEFDAYVNQIQAFLDRGLPVGGIGCQTHLTGPVDWDKFEKRLNRLAEFGLPIKITEYDQEKVDDPQRAKDLRRLYMTCFANPAVEGIYMWGFWEGSHWRPETAIWKKDWTPTPAAEAFDQLVFHDWWTQAQGQAGDDGTFTTIAFFGRHRITVNGKPYEVELTKDHPTQRLDTR